MKKVTVKKVVKRFAATGMALLLLLSLGACGGNTDGEDGKTNKDNGTIEEGDSNLSWDEIKKQIPKELVGTTVKVYNWNPANFATGSVIAIEKFEEETGINVEWITGSYDTYATDIAAMVTSGEAPDIVRMRDADFSLMKLLKPLSEIDYDFTDQAWNHELMKEYQVNGEYYAVAMDNTPYVNPLIMYYNKAFIKKYNLEDPYELWKNGEWTWDKCMEITEQFLNAAGDNYNGLALHMGTDYAASLGATMFSYDAESSQYVSHMSDTKLVKGWQFVSQNVKKGLIMNRVYQNTFFEKELLLFCNIGSIGARTTHNYFTQQKENGTLGTVPIPAVAGQQEYYQFHTELEAYAIPKGAKNAEAAAYFLRYYLDAEHYDMNAFYCDDQAKEVVDWCMNQKVISDMQRIIYKDQYGVDWTDIAYNLMLSDVGQIKTHLDTYSPIIDNIVETGNKTLSTMTGKK